METWDVQNKGNLYGKSARVEVVEGKVSLETIPPKYRPTVCKMPDLSGKSYERARLIAACPTMFGKLVDTVAWLDREIKGWERAILNEAGPSTIERLTELRDDLAETLRKITEGE